MTFVKIFAILQKIQYKDRRKIVAKKHRRQPLRQHHNYPSAPVFGMEPQQVYYIKKHLYLAMTCKNLVS